MKIYTRTGDTGETGLIGGRRVSKADPRVEAYGDVDETNAIIGVAHAAWSDSGLDDLFTSIQRDLFAIGARLADPAHQGRQEKAAIGAEQIARVEQAIDALEGRLPPLKRFILPGGSASGAALHHARTVCRRAERRIVSLGPGAVEPEILAYMNRLSDLLFVTARAANKAAGASEVEW